MVKIHVSNVEMPIDLRVIAGGDTESLPCYLVEPALIYSLGKVTSSNQLRLLKVGLFVHCISLNKT